MLKSKENKHKFYITQENLGYQWQYVTDKRLKKPKLYRQQGSKDAGTKASRDV